MEKRVMEGLVCEWKWAAYNLPKKYCRLHVPCFEIRDMTSMWGSWQGDRKAIVLSRRLITQFSWLSVREVLLHEMAHQLTDEAFGGDDTPHGRRFHEACHMLGADPKASGNLPSIHQWITKDSAGDGDRILSRVRKLMAMGQSTSRHEAEIAMTKVHEYMAKYNVSLHDCGEQPSFFSMGIGEPALRFTAEKYAMMSLLREFYFVSTVLVPAYVMSAARMGRVIEIGGRIENLKMAGYVYDFLNRSIARQWMAFNKTGRFTQHRRTDFALGLIQGFQERLETQKQTFLENDDATKALVHKGNKELTEYLRDRYPRLRSISRRGKMMDAGVLGAGVEAGRRTVLSRPIENRTRSRGLHIEA
jgi:hypothetical protein